MLATANLEPSSSLTDSCRPSTRQVTWGSEVVEVDLRFCLFSECDSRFLASEVGGTLFSREKSRAACQHLASKHFKKLMQAEHAKWITPGTLEFTRLTAFLEGHGCWYCGLCNESHSASRKMPKSEVLKPAIKPCRCQNVPAPDDHIYSLVAVEARRLEIHQNYCFQSPFQRDVLQVDYVPPVYGNVVLPFQLDQPLPT